MLKEKLKNTEIILGSGSPRRRELLSEMGFIFKVETREVEESIPVNLNPMESAVFLSKLKAGAFGKDFFNENTILITADTIVVLDDKILGKPSNRQHAIEMLQNLSGKVHEVITGITLKSEKKETSFFATTKVWFKRLTNEEIEFYVDNYKPFDKAGAYGIQEWIGYVAVEKIEGSYFNVVGLPTNKLYEELIRF